MNTEIRQRFPLRKAYPFAQAKGLDERVREIRAMQVNWQLRYSSTVRRRYLIRELQRRDLLSEFIEQL